MLVSNDRWHLVSLIMPQSRATSIPFKHASVETVPTLGVTVNSLSYDQWNGVYSLV